MIGFCVIAASKGKVWSTIGGMFIPFIGIVAAIRLARPGSWWAKRRYAPGGKKMAKAEERGARHVRRRTRMLNAIGGTPDKPSPRSKG